MLNLNDPEAQSTLEEGMFDFAIGFYPKGLDTPGLTGDILPPEIGNFKVATAFKDNGKIGIK